MHRVPLCPKDAPLADLASARDRNEALEIADRLVRFKADLGRLGLFKTMHALDAATQSIGWEIADKFNRSDL